jgi:hypothetical protein
MNISVNEKTFTMDQIKRILAPTDLSELSLVGVRYALNLAKAIGAEATIYHVVDYDTLVRYGQRSTAPSSFQPPDHDFLERYECFIPVPEGLCFRSYCMREGPGEG